MDQLTQSNQNSLWQAGTTVADSLTQFEGALDKLVNRMELTGEQMQKVMEIKDRAQNVLNQVVGYSQRAVDEVKRNPKVYLALAAAVGMFLMSRKGGPLQNTRISEFIANQETH